MEGAGEAFIKGTSRPAPGSGARSRLCNRICPPAPSAKTGLGKHGLKHRRQFCCVREVLNFLPPAGSFANDFTRLAPGFRQYLSPHLQLHIPMSFPCGHFGSRGASPTQLQADVFWRAGGQPPRGPCRGRTRWCQPRASSPDRGKIKPPLAQTLAPGYDHTSPGTKVLRR